MVAVNLTVPQEQPATTLLGPELFRGIQAGNNVKITIDQVTDRMMTVITPFLGFPTVAIANGATIPSGINVISVAGYYAYGDGGGANYRRVGSQPDHSVWIQTADGAYWVPIVQGGLSILVTGAVADGELSGHQIVGGTDNWAFIQNAVDAHTYFGLGDYVHFPNGYYRTTNTIQCGYGTDLAQYNGTRLLGALQTNPEAGNAGSVLLCDFSDRPGVACQGQRAFLMSGIALYGRARAYIEDNGLGSPGCAMDDSDEDNWLDPTLHANANSQTAPYAGVAIDPYSGDSPAIPYPDVIFPAFLGGGISQYNKAFSSDLIIEKFDITGFVVDVVNHPNEDTEGNGDFLCLRDGSISMSVYGISIGHTQCRNVHRERIDFNQMFCCETTSTHGAQNGKMDGININCAFGNTINLFLFENDASIFGPITYLKLYGEANWRLGNFGNSTGVDHTAIIFDNCDIGFDSQVADDPRGIPPSMISGGNQPVNVQFKGGAFGSYYSVFPILLYSGEDGDLTIDGTQFTKVNFGLFDNQYEWFANNVTCGGVVTVPLQSRTGAMRIKSRIYDVDTGDVGSCAIQGPVNVGSDRSSPCPCFFPNAGGNDDQSSQYLPVPDNTNRFYIDKSQSYFTLATLVDRELQFTLSGGGYTDAYQVMKNGPLPGDVLVDEDSQSIFFVHYYSAGLVKATLQNNFRGDFTLHNPINLTTGYISVINSRVYMPANFLQGDITSASDDVTNAGTADGDTGQMTGDIANGDRYYNISKYDNSFGESDTIVSALAAGSFTLSSNANYTQARKRFGFFIRPGAPNS